MASPQSTALKHWARIIKQWPVDKVRPESVSFQRLMQQRLQRSTQTTPTAATTTKKAGEAAQPRSWDEAHEMKQANVLYALLENRYEKENPTPQALRYPASNPTHYDDIVREMQEAPSRSWFSGVMTRIKGSLRFR